LWVLLYFCTYYIFLHINTVQYIHAQMTSRFHDEENVVWFILHLAARGAAVGHVSEKDKIQISDPGFNSNYDIFPCLWRQKHHFDAAPDLAPAPQRWFRKNHTLYLSVEEVNVPLLKTPSLSVSFSVADSDNCCLSTFGIFQIARIRILNQLFNDSKYLFNYFACITYLNFCSPYMILIRIWSQTSSLFLAHICLHRKSVSSTRTASMSSTIYLGLPAHKVWVLYSTSLLILLYSSWVYLHRKSVSSTRTASSSSSIFQRFTCIGSLCLLLEQPPWLPPFSWVYLHRKSVSSRKQPPRPPPSSLVYLNR
jgi:hypothetical protein